MHSATDHLSPALAKYTSHGAASARARRRREMYGTKRLQISTLHAMQAPPRPSHPVAGPPRLCQHGRILASARLQCQLGTGRPSRNAKTCRTPACRTFSSRARADQHPSQRRASSRACHGGRLEEQGPTVQNAPSVLVTPTRTALHQNRYAPRDHRALAPLAAAGLRGVRTFRWEAPTPLAALQPSTRS